MNNELTLPFLGQRAYLHGTTLFEALAPHIPSWKDVSFKISAPLCTNTVCLSSQPRPDTTHAAHMRSTQGGQEHTVYVYPLEMRLPVHREPFDEHSLATQTVFHANSADYTTAWTYSFVKTTVSINKALLQKMYPEKTQGQWVFTALELHTKPEHAPLHLAVTATMGRGKLVHTQIFLAGQAVGNLLFSWLDRPIV